ncbi:MAG: DNA replication/repair protein RecF [Armatimonadetes bacterium]|nr:DNA replication/repair protein RecF [Armatimonadota bacterium]
MYLQHLDITDFRNYESLSVDLPAGVVVLHGDNGAGKSSFLEAVCLTATGESPRTRMTGEMVRADCEHGFVRGHFGRSDHSAKVEVGLARSGQRQLKVDGVVRRRADLIGRVPVVLFWVEDIEMVRGEPSSRRRLINRELSAVSKAYDYHLRRYRRATEQRNRLLKLVRDKTAKAEALDPWDRAVARHGAQIMVERARFLAALAPQAQRAHTLVTEGRKDLRVAYCPSVGMSNGQTSLLDEKNAVTSVEDTTGALLRALQADRSRDLRYGVTNCGPHRDDIELLLDGNSVKAFGSQGEQRSCAVALRLASAAVLREMTGQTALLLLDDVLSELDERHRQGVFEACEADQVIVTCCDEQDIPTAARASGAVFSVAGGRIAGAS